MTHRGAWVVCLVLATGLSGCASAPLRHELLDAFVERNIELAQQHLDQGELIEAHQIIQAGKALDPSHPEIRRIMSSIGSDQPSLIMPSPLGVNRLKRIPATPSRMKRIIMYLPDRLLDALDLVGFDIHLGPGGYLNYHITRALQVGGGARTVLGLGWHTKRSLGLLGKAEAGLSAVAAGAQTYNAAQVGTSGIQAGAYHQAGLHRPIDPLYQEMRDYWAVGADATIIFLGLSWDVHPVELFDFISGFFLRDFLNDDLSSTRGLRLTTDDKRHIQNVLDIIRTHREELERYHKAKEASR